MSQYTGVRSDKEIFHAINYRHVEYVIDVIQACHTLASGFFFLCVLRLNAPVNIFSVMSGRSQLGLTSTVRS